MDFGEGKVGFFASVPSTEAAPFSSIDGRYGKWKKNKENPVGDVLGNLPIANGACFFAEMNRHAAGHPGRPAHRRHPAGRKPVHVGRFRCGTGHVAPFRWNHNVGQLTLGDSCDPAICNRRSTSSTAYSCSPTSGLVMLCCIV